MYCDYHGGKFIDEYKDYDKAQLKPILPPEEQLARMMLAFDQETKTIQSILVPFIEKICANFVTVVKTINEVVLKTYPNKRVVYLALHGKRRVRKKNINRIKKWIEREGKNERNTF
jgi:hypothetical protein